MTAQAIVLLVLKFSIALNVFALGLAATPHRCLLSVPSTSGARPRPVVDERDHASHSVRTRQRV